MHRGRSFKQAFRISFLKYTIALFIIMIVICLVSFWGYKNFVLADRHCVTAADLQQELTLFFVVMSVVLPILMSVVCYFLAERVSRKYVDAVQVFLYAMRAPTLGRLSYRLDVKSGDEFEIIARQYNHMMEQIQRLIIRTKEINDRRRIAEIKQLEEQFNPHFIFNVLESLKCMVLTEQEKWRTINMITALARIMRYSISTEKSMVEIEDDLKYIRDYLAVQKERFGDRLSYIIDMDEGAKYRYIPKLIIQPLVENSIKYGYENKEVLHISIQVKWQENRIKMVVEDDGGGMEESRLQEIRDLLGGKISPQESTHIGLYNVHRRLQLIYGSGAGITLTSEFGKGTAVALVILYKEANGNV